MITWLWPLAFLPQLLTLLLGRLLGRIAFRAIPRWRKRALSNLALAKALDLSPKEIVSIARQSFENVGITALEYPKLLFRKNFLPALCLNPEPAQKLLEEHKGLVFFCGHQANWELLFLEGTKRMPGTAIGRPIKQRALYRRIVAMREKYGGKIIAPKEAIKEGMRALKQGRFLGIVGDQGMPESPFACDFLGRRAYTTTAPALLALKLGVPLIVATIARVGLRYQITYSDPIPSTDVETMMREALAFFENSVKQNPGQWLWFHNRWKQETPKNITYRFRHDTILLLVDRYAPFLDIFKEIYPRAFITVVTRTPFESPHFDVICAKSDCDFFSPDYRFKLIFNFTSHKVKRHYLKYAAAEVLDEKSLWELARHNKEMNADTPLEEVIKTAIGRRGVLWS
jgi:KDO2-lipid IV(A) lauroyltransferase